MTHPRSDARTIAVIGGGPRGVAVVERLIANGRALDVPQVRIVLIEPHRPGGGRVWDADQPSHLLMNTLCADATHYTDETVEMRGPVTPGPTLYDWSRRIVTGEVRDLGSPDRPLTAGHRAEAGSMEPHSHPSRRFLGGYLEWCHAQDVLAAPASISVQHVPGTAVSVELIEGRWSVEVQDMAHEEGADPARPERSGTVRAEAVVIATGHSDAEPVARLRELVDSAAAAGLWHGRPTSPLSQHGLDELDAGGTVIVRGLGMNFFDYLSLLTIGRGGEFLPDPSGRDALVYRPSGREPWLVVGSGRGIPYRAKGRFGRMTPAFPKHHLTPELLASLRRSDEEGAHVDFMSQLLPAVMKDAVRLHCTVLAQQHPERLSVPVTEVVAALDDLEWGSPELDAALARAVPDPQHRLDVPTLDRPLEGIELASSEELRQWWLRDLRRDVHEADLGMGSALKCASVQIGAGRGPLRTLVRYGGIEATSYRDHVEGWFRGFAGMLASGPPARRIEELIALVEAGIVQPLGARMTVEVRDGHYLARSPTVPGVVHRAQALLEAHLPPADLPRTRNPLLRDLRDAGRGRPYVLGGGQDRAEVTTGALEVGPPPYRVVDREGREQPGLYAVGVPLESLLWGTQLQPLARTNSRFLREIDEVARDALVPGIDETESSGSDEPERLHAEESA